MTRRLEGCRYGAIDDYLETLEPPDAAIIAHIYEVARCVVPDAEQGLGYGMRRSSTAASLFCP
jgi:hypothetical protein